MIEITDAGQSVLITGLNDGDKEVNFSKGNQSITLDVSADMVSLSDGRASYSMDYNDVSIPAGITSAVQLREYINSLNTSGGGGGGDASAANQTTQIGLETQIVANTSDNATETTLQALASSGANAVNQQAQILIETQISADSTTTAANTTSIAADTTSIDSKLSDISDSVSSAPSDQLHSVETSSAKNANSTANEYMVVGFRLINSGDLVVQNAATYAATNDNYIMRARLNPTINNSGSLVWAANGPFGESAEGLSGNPSTSTVTGGQLLKTRYGRFQAGELLMELNTTIANINDEIIITVQPLSTNLDILGSINTIQ